MSNATKKQPIGYIYRNRQHAEKAMAPRKGQHLSPLFSSPAVHVVPCTCGALDMRKELKCLCKKSEKALNEVYDEISTYEEELSKYLKEINLLEKELEWSLRNEKKILADIETIEKHEVDSTIDFFLEDELQPALRERDEKIQILEEELNENMKSIQMLERHSMI